MFLTHILTPNLNMLKKDAAALLKMTRSRHSPAIAKRARLVLMAEAGHSNAEIARFLGITPHTVGRIRSRFKNQGIVGLEDRPKSGRPPSADQTKRATLLETLCKAPPAGMKVWSVRSLARHLEMAPATAGRLLNELQLRPHRLWTESFTPSPRFGERFLDAAGLFMAPRLCGIILSLEPGPSRKFVTARAIDALDFFSGGGKKQDSAERKNRLPWVNEYLRAGFPVPLPCLKNKPSRQVCCDTEEAFFRFLDHLVKQNPNSRLYILHDRVELSAGSEVGAWMKKHPDASFHCSPNRASWINLLESFFKIVPEGNGLPLPGRKMEEFLTAYLPKVHELSGPLIWANGQKTPPSLFRAARGKNLAGTSPADGKPAAAAFPTRLEDIAGRLGVSKTTVSRVLRGAGNVRAETRLKVIKCAEEVGYTRDPALAALAAYRHRRMPPSGFSQLAFVTDYERLMEGAWRYVRIFLEAAVVRGKEFGYKVEEFKLRENGRDHREASSILFHRGIKGLIIAPVRQGRNSLNLTWDYFSSVAIGYSLDSPKLNYVAFDSHYGMQTVFHELRNRGYSRIGLVLILRQSVQARHTLLDAFLGEHHRSSSSGLKTLPYFTIQATREDGVFTFERAMAGFWRWFNHYKPDAIITAPQFAPRLLEEKRFQDSNSVGLACYSRQDYHEPALAGIQDNMREIGAAAVDCLHAQLLRHEFGIPSTHRGTLLHGVWKEGATLRRRPDAALV